MEKRVALVIGNGAYEDATPLFNPTNDAKAVAAAFKALSFELITVDGHTDCNTDLGLINMARALADFSVAAETAETAIFYFAGHGLEVDGQNYLLPKDARLDYVRRIYFETIKLADVRAAVEHASHLRLILLDACRNDPFRVPMRGLDGRRSVARGLARTEPNGNTGVAYAAKHGTTASDGPFGGNSPFAKALIKHLPTPGLEVRLLFGQIKDEVWKATSGTQEPHFYSNFGGQGLYLVPAAAEQAVAEAIISKQTPEAPRPQPEAISPALQAAQALWAEFRIEETEDPELIEAYIRQVENAPLMVYKARQRLAVVQELLRQREAAKWQTACAAGTEAAYEDYLAAWPSGAHAADANTRIAGLREDAQWQEAVAAGTLEGFRNYVRDYPRGRYGDEARRRIGELEQAERREREARERAEAEARARAEAEAQKRQEEEDRRAGILRVIVGTGGEQDAVRRIKPGSGEVFQDAPFAPEMVVVPSGEFKMGSPENEPERSSTEGPQHEVIIPQPFAVGRYAVTFAEWDAAVADGGCGGYKPSDQGWGRGDRPVINVNWDDAQAYVKWLREKTGKRYRLLSEAEWEYVARAGAKTRYWWGDSILKDQANYSGGGSKTVPVSSFKPNPWGLYQVHGNVWEWCEDVWHDSYEGAPAEGAAWMQGGDGSRRVLRGGSWNYDPQFLRSAYRYRNTTDYRDYFRGFRLART